MKSEGVLKKEKPRKRTSYFRRSRLELPEGLDRSRFAFRWISMRNVEMRSDGYDPRGFELYKNKDGKTVRSGDLVLGYITKEENELRKQERDYLAKDQTKRHLESQKAQDDRLSYEAKKHGGGIRFEYGEE